MESIDFESYFDSTDKFQDSEILITILESVLNLNLDEIKNIVNSAKVEVTKEQIIEFLQRKKKINEEIESSETKRYPYESSYSVIKLDIKTLLRNYRYSFNPYTLEYFKNYINILKNKILVLLNIIENIGTKQSKLIQDLLIEYDISLDENGNILKEDIARLVKPTIYNINELNQMVIRSNNLSEYLYSSVSKEKMLKDRITEVDILPTPSLQVKNLYYDGLEGNIPLTDKQKDEIRKSQSRDYMYFLKRSCRN